MRCCACVRNRVQDRADAVSSSEQARTLSLRSSCQSLSGEANRRGPLHQHDQTPDLHPQILFPVSKSFSPNPRVDDKVLIRLGLSTSDHDRPSSPPTRADSQTLPAGLPNVCAA
eukprot:3425721-Rhodomonas_salina.1